LLMPVPALLTPPALGAPEAAPLVPIDPVAGDPALGDAAELPVAAVPVLVQPAFGDAAPRPAPAPVPLAAPPDEAPPAEPPPPPPLPPPACAIAAMGFRRAATINNLTGNRFRMAWLLIESNAGPRKAF